MYVIGLQFHIETAHKTLVPLLTTNRLDELSPRPQRFRMRLLQNDYSIGHVAGKAMYTADVLSRKPLPDGAHRTREFNTREYEILTLEQLAASQDMLDRIKNQLQVDPVTKRIIEYTLGARPDTKSLLQEVRRFYQIAGELAFIDGLLFRGNRLVRPEEVRLEIVEKLHRDHEGVSK